jgi:hypothetical protein
LLMCIIDTATETIQLCIIAVLHSIVSISNHGMMQSLQLLNNYV